MYRSNSASGGPRRTTTAHSLESQVARITYVFSSIALRHTGHRPDWRDVNADLKMAVGYTNGIRTIELVAVDPASNTVLARWTSRFGARVGKAFVNDPELSPSVRRRLAACRFNVIVNWGSDEPKFRHRLRLNWTPKTERDGDLMTAQVTRELNSVWANGVRVHVSSSHVRNFRLRPGQTVVGTLHREAGGTVFNINRVVSR